MYHTGELPASAALQATLQYNKETREVSVTYPDAATEKSVLKAGAPTVIADELDAAMDLEEEIVNTAETTSELDARQAAQLKAMITGWGQDWRKIPLDDMKVKFAVHSSPSLSLSTYTKLTIMPDNQTPHTSSQPSHPRPNHPSKPENRRSHQIACCAAAAKDAI